MLKPFSTKQYSDTNVEEVKRLNAQSGLSYNEVKELLAAKYRKEQKWDFSHFALFFISSVFQSYLT